MLKIIFALAVILSLQLSLSQSSVAAMSNEIFVDISGACEGKTPCYASIQEALNSASKDDAVKVYPGTYVEQITIPLPVKLVSTHGPELTVIEAPSIDSRTTVTHTFQFGTRSVDYAILVNGIHGQTTIEGFTIDGKREGTVSGTYTGIYIVDSAEVTIKDNIIKGFRDMKCADCPDGTGILVRSGAEETSPESRTSEVTVEHNFITDYQKAGVVINEAGSTVKLINDNTIIGSGVSSVVPQNGIQIGFGAFIDPEKLVQNKISGNYHEVKGQEIKVAIAILILHADGATAEDRATYMQNNAVDDNQVPVAVIP